MNGPQHYREAEQLLAESRTILRNNDETCPEADRLIAEAHVHALLAKVALDALNSPICDSDNGTGHPSEDHYVEWVEVIEMGEVGERDDEGVAYGGTTDPSIVSQQNAENMR